MLGELCQPTGAVPEFFHKLMMSASAEMSKSNRRKQSKPNRLMANEGGVPPLNPELLENPKAMTDASPTKSGTPDSRHGEEMQVDMGMDLSKRSARSSRNVSPMSEAAVPPSSAASEIESSAVNYPCHTCGEMFPSRSKQEQHIADYHSSDSPKEKQHPPTGSLFPTAYQQLVPGMLHRDMMMASSRPSDSPPKTSSANGVAGVPSLGTPGVGGKGSAGTVFQREAYCDLCQREFCNKYFLKTHKANIHGIVDPNDPKAVAALAKVSHQAPKINSSPVSDSASSQRTPVSGMSGQQKSGEGNQSMEDFCEICQKHFCNKYYLKKHKSDVHNLRADGSKPPTSNESVFDNQAFQRSVTSSSLPPLPMMVPPLNSFAQSSMNNMLFVNPFQNMHAAMSMMPPMMQHQFFMPGMGGLAATLPQNLSPPELKSEPVAKLTPKLENGESLPDGEKTDTVNCNICRKEFRNSHYLQIHRVKKHNLLDDPASTALLMSLAAAEQKELAERPKLSVSPASSDASTNKRPVSVLTSDKDRIQTSPAFNLTSSQSLKLPSGGQPNFSFDAILAAKQADRIMCDICNKDVCNKYFLKAHKLKMHGIATPSEDKRTTPTKDTIKQTHSNSPQDSLQQAIQQQQQQQMSPPDAITSRLVKLGIDPEAYCFLCKKEFCSKYFLKTHKLNMHGVGSERAEQGQRGVPRGTITPPTSVSPVSAYSPAQQPAASIDTFQWRWKDGNQKLTNPYAPNGNTTPPGGGDKFQWRWKEPANSMRVFCDICDKELCNKYFLRTHKLKIHGISHSGETTSEKTNNQAMTASSVMADLARVSQANQRNQDYKPQSPSAPSGSTSPTEMDTESSMRDDVCQVCGRVFEDLMAVRKHMQMEHSDEDFEFTKSMAEDKLYTCSQCPFKCLNREDLADHEAANHDAEMNSCKQCQVTFSHLHMLVKHMQEIHNQLVSPTQLQKAAKMVKGTRKRIRCTHCSERFSTKELCKAHIRKEHRSKSTLTMAAKLLRLNDKTKPNKVSISRVFSCEKCSYSCAEYRNLRIHQALKHRTRPSESRRSSRTEICEGGDTIMQEFSVSSCSGADSIATSTITLPVYNKITEKFSVNLTLIPSN